MPNRTYTWLCLSRDIPCDNASLIILAPDGSLLVSKNTPPAANNISIDVKNARSGRQEINLTWSHRFASGSRPYTISCIVQCFDGRWREKLSFTIRVHNAPIVTVDSPTLRAPLETTVTLTCGVKANPKVMNITWYIRHSDDSFESNLRARQILQDVDVHSTVLTLSRVTREHSGIYIATAVNSIGVGRSHGVTVVVDSKIGPPNVTVPPAIPPVIQGQLVVIPCHVTSRSTPSVVTWYKDGQLIDWGKRDYHGGDVEVPVLNIPEGIEPDSGEYVCSATNIMGQGNSSAVSVHIYTVPAVTITRADEPIFSLLDDDVTIPCSYTATRPTRLLWYKDDVVVNIPGERFEGGTLSTPSLTIKGTQVNDSGEFMCEVQTSLATEKSQRVYLVIDKSALPDPKVVPLGLFQRGQHVVVVTVCTYYSALPFQPENLTLTWISRNPNLTSVMEVKNLRKQSGRYTQYNSALNLKQFNKTDIGTTFVCTVQLEGATSSVEWTLSDNDLRVAGAS